MNKIETIKNAIADGSYNWDEAVTDTAEKIIVEAVANDIWKCHQLGVDNPVMNRCEYFTALKNQFETDGRLGDISLDEAERGVKLVQDIMGMMTIEELEKEVPQEVVLGLRL